MGLGGNLIWTSVFDALAEGGERPVACASPLISDLLSGVLYRRDKSFENDPIFRLNPHIRHIEAKSKSRPVALMDRLFEKTISPDPIRRRYETWIFNRSLQAHRNEGTPLLVHVDMRIHSYAVRQTKQKMVWKLGGNAAHVIARKFGFSLPEQHCSLWFSKEERKQAETLLAKNGIASPFIVVETDTNVDWFGDLRAWPMERWADLFHQIQKKYPDHQIVQIGLVKKRVLDGVINLTGQTSFRQAALVMKQANLFLGTEGGLMHAAAAVNVPAVILWGGITLPKFAGYPQLQEIVCLYVDCAPCGNLGWCNNGHRCMQDITVTRAMMSVEKMLSYSGKEN